MPCRNAQRGPSLGHGDGRAAPRINTCRSKGIQGSNTDCLLCAVAERRGLAILTTDRDFERFAAGVHVRLHVPG
jgi:predicted nucleic acid-binding protein